MKGPESAAAARSSEPAAGPRAAELARARRIASGLLVLMAVVFVAASLVREQFGWAPYVRAFAEAGMVGACADWFAVTALFRRPFGLPIPHTGIIPRNKARIGRALGDFIADNFLTVRVLDEKLRQLELARWGGAWLTRGDNARRLAERIAAMLPGLVQALPREATRDLVAGAALGAARAAPAGPIAARLLGAVWREGRAQPLVDRLVESAADYLAEHREFVEAKVSEHSYSWLPRFIDKAIADKITDGLIRVVEEMRDPDHPWRAELARMVEGLILRLETDPELQGRVEAFKQRLLSDPDLMAHAEGLWAELEARLSAELAGQGEGIARRLEAGLLALGRWLDTDEDAQRRLTHWARLVIRRVIAPRRRQVGNFVAQVVEGWDARDVVERLELQVGKDLQFIRINGTLVGGLVGLTIYVAAQVLGLG